MSMPRSRSSKTPRTTTTGASGDADSPGAGLWLMTRLDLTGVGLLAPEQAVPLLLQQSRSTRSGYAVVPLRKKPNVKLVGARLVFTAGDALCVVAELYRPEAPDHFGPEMRAQWKAAGVPAEEVKAWVVVREIQELTGLTTEDLLRDDGTPLGKYDTDKTLRPVRFKPGRQPL